MSRHEKIMWIIFAVVLAMLFLASTTSLFIGERKQEVYPISIILDDTKDEYYINLKKGIDRAAADYNVDINFLTLYEGGNQELQTEQLIREIADGAKAVITAPVDERKAVKELDETVINSPILILNSEIVNDSITMNIKPDYYTAGIKLGEAVIKEQSLNTPVYIFMKGMEYTGISELYSGFISEISAEQYDVKLFTGQTSDSFRQVIEAQVYPGTERAAIVALDAESLTYAADIIDKSPTYGEYITGLYGIGTSTYLLNKLDSGIISGLAVYNQYDMGYMAVTKAVEAIRGLSKRETIIYDCSYIKKEDLRDSLYESMLYPTD